MNTHYDFCKWLQGFLEGRDKLTAAQIKIVQARLKDVAATKPKPIKEIIREREAPLNPIPYIPPINITPHSPAPWEETKVWCGGNDIFDKAYKVAISSSQ